MLKMLKAIRTIYSNQIFNVKVYINLFPLSGYCILWQLLRMVNDCKMRRITTEFAVGPGVIA